MKVKRGIENKVKRLVNDASDHNDITFNWYGEAYRASFVIDNSGEIPEWTGSIKVYRQIEEENRELYVGTVKDLI